MRVHRLIFRMDFLRPNFHIIDAPGAVMKILSEMGDDKYWPEFKDSTANRVISVTARDEKNGIFRQFSVEPTAMHLLFESAKGTSFTSLLEDNQVATLFKGVDSFCDFFNVSALSRAGIRFIALDNIPTKQASLLSTTASLVDSSLLGSVKSILGDPTDLGIAIDGEGSDKLGYHFRLGPYAANEAKKYFSPDTEKDLSAAGDSSNFVSDIDFFELNFSMTVRASKWCKVPIDKAQKILGSVPGLLSKRG